jgi:hypothetical protein
MLAGFKDMAYQVNGIALGIEAGDLVTHFDAGGIRRIDVQGNMVPARMWHSLA